ncbi:MAG: S24 family peptidase [Lachnospiraceae bacterium]|nr:S24 family peptidase [Lachnospiraceae bacterium]
MNESSGTKLRLLQFLKYLNIGQQKFELSIGMSNGWVNKIGDNIRENTLQRIKEVYPELNIAWLKTGVGEMLNVGIEKNSEGTSELEELIRKVSYKRGIKGYEIAQLLNISPSYLSGIRKGVKAIPSNFMEQLSALLPNDGDNEDTLHTPAENDHEEITATLVPLLPIAAQGGSLSEFVVSVKENDCEKVVSPVRGADFAMPVSGDSMAPEYPNGSQIFIKKINEAAFIEWGKVYVLDTCNGTVIKILVPSEKDGYVKCVSINKDPIYAPFEVAWKDVFGVYRVLLCMSVK